MAGYDFVSDPVLSLDGLSRDPDWTDPGDGTPACPGNSWHGMQVSSVLAAAGFTAYRSVCPVSPHLACPIST